MPPGYTRVEVEVTPGALVSLLLLGERDALHHFAVGPVPAVDPLEEDGLLPRVASFRAPADLTSVVVSLEVETPATLRRLQASPDRSEVELIGLPCPAERDDGFLLERPGRYQFGRPDVLASLLEAFRTTRHRFRRDPIGVTDLSQWDGRRPASDLGQPRHVSHEGGRDVDVALPSTVEPSTRRDHCEKLVSQDLTTGVCRRGTAREVDYARLAFLLGRLVKTGRVERIFLDAEFLGPLGEAARRLTHPPGFPAWVADRLQPETGIVRHVAWHTDHVHVRFVLPGATSSAPAR